MIVSLETIFLSIFVLMAQTREAVIGELREELALQVNLAAARRSGGRRRNAWRRGANTV